MCSEKNIIIFYNCILFFYSIRFYIAPPPPPPPPRTVIFFCETKVKCVQKSYHSFCGNDINYKPSMKNGQSFLVVRFVTKIKYLPRTPIYGAKRECMAKYTILPKVLGHPLLMKGLTTLVISMSTNLNV